MKDGSISILTVIFSISLLIFACHKEITYFVKDNKEEIPSKLLGSAKNWYLQHLDTRTPFVKKYGTLPIYWEDTRIVKTIDSSEIIIVPAVGADMDNNNFTFKRFLTFRITDQGIADGRIIEMIGENYDVGDNFDFLLKNYNLKTISGFNGGIIQYDVSYRKIRDVFYKDGRKNDLTHISFVSVPGGIN